MTTVQQYVKENVNLLDNYDLAPAVRLINKNKLLNHCNVHVNLYDRLFENVLGTPDFQKVRSVLDEFIKKNFSSIKEFFIYNVMLLSFPKVSVKCGTVNFEPYKPFTGSNIYIWQLLTVISVYLQQDLDYSNHEVTDLIPGQINQLESEIARTDVGEYTVNINNKVFKFKTFKNGKVKCDDPEFIKFVDHYSKLYYKVCHEQKNF